MVQYAAHLWSTFWLPRWSTSGLERVWTKHLHSHSGSLLSAGQCKCRVAASDSNALVDYFCPWKIRATAAHGGPSEVQRVFLSGSFQTPLFPDHCQTLQLYSNTLLFAVWQLLSVVCDGLFPLTQHWSDANHGSISLEGKGLGEVWVTHNSWGC